MTKKRTKRIGNMPNKECEFLVFLETKIFVFFRLDKRSYGWQENLKMTTLS